MRLVRAVVARSPATHSYRSIRRLVTRLARRYRALAEAVGRGAEREVDLSLAEHLAREASQATHNPSALEIAEALRDCGMVGAVSLRFIVACAALLAAVEGGRPEAVREGISKLSIAAETSIRSLRALLKSLPCESSPRKRSELRALHALFTCCVSVASASIIEASTRARPQGTEPLVPARVLHRSIARLFPRLVGKPNDPALQTDEPLLDMREDEVQVRAAPTPETASSPPRDAPAFLRGMHRLLGRMLPRRLTLVRAAQMSAAPWAVLSLARMRRERRDGARLLCACAVRSGDLRGRTRAFSEETRGEEEPRRSYRMRGSPKCIDGGSIDGGRSSLLWEWVMRHRSRRSATRCCRFRC